MYQIITFSKIVDHTHLHIQTCMHAYMYAFIHACKHACMHTCKHTYMLACTHMYNIYSDQRKFRGRNFRVTDF